MKLLLQVGWVWLLSAAALFAGDKPKGAPLTKLPTKTVEIKELFLAHPRQACPNWAWAAALETMLAEQSVDLRQTYWILKGFAGELCIETPVDLEAIQRLIRGDYVLEDGRKIHLDAVVTQGAPTDVGNLIANVRDGHALMMLWQGRPVLLHALDYDEYIYPNNQRMYEAIKLTMVDLLSNKEVVFKKGTDNMDDLGGLFEVQVTPAGTR